MRYYYRLWGFPWFSLRVKKYYLIIKNSITDMYFSFFSHIYIFTGIKFKIGGSKK